MLATGGSGGSGGSGGVEFGDHLTRQLEAGSRK